MLNILLKPADTDQSQKRLRRKIEDFLRKSASRQELDCIARYLGIISSVFIMLLL